MDTSQPKTDASVSASVAQAIGFPQSIVLAIKSLGLAIRMPVCEHSGNAAVCDRAACRLYEHCRGDR